MDSLQQQYRYYLPLLTIGGITGLLALVPSVGWLLGLCTFLLAYLYSRRTTFISDSLITLLLWLLIRVLLVRAS